MEGALKKEERAMRKWLTILVLMLGISLCATVQAFDGQPPHGSLKQLPADKEMLFHQTMRGVWETTANIREQSKMLETELRSALTASEFNEALFLQKAKSLQELHETMKEAMDDAIVSLAKQFTAEERKILAELISHKPGPMGPPGPPPDR
jgi:uncharacterized membrane protein